MTNSWKMNQLDFRFADEEDAEDIKSLINTVYVHEEEGQGDGGFRPPGDPKIHVSELIDDLESSSIRWIVLETPRPEEAIIAALRLHILRSAGESSQQYALVDLFGSLEPQSQRSVCNMLLNRAETVCRSLGCKKIVFEVPNWSEERHAWLSTCGYIDLRGHAWPDERQDEVTRYTMVLEFEKSLLNEKTIQSPSSWAPPTRAFPPLPASSCGHSDEDVIIDVDYNTGSSSTSSDNMSDPMFPIISDLFSALHAEASSSSCAGEVEVEVEVEVLPAGGSLVPDSQALLDLSALLSSLPQFPDASSSTPASQAATVNQSSGESDPMVDLIGDLFAALHTEARGSGSI